MFNSSMMLITVLPLIAMINMISNQKHFLMTLLSLEGITLTIVLFIPMSMMVMNMPCPTVSVIVLTFGACEASLGLSIMVNMSRFFGSDMMKSMNLVKC